MVEVSDYSEILPGVQRCVAESLALDEDEVLLGALLIPELGADSLDFIDILFMLEKEFSIKIREGELGFLARLDASDPSAARDAVLDAAEVDAIRPWLPALGDRREVTPGELFSLISVETLCIMVARRRAAAQEDAS
jgi:acyl carrier protein